MSILVSSSLKNLQLLYISPSNSIPRHPHLHRRKTPRSHQRSLSGINIKGSLDSEFILPRSSNPTNLTLLSWPGCGVWFPAVWLLSYIINKKLGRLLSTRSKFLPIFLQQCSGTVHLLLTKSTVLLQIAIAVSHFYNLLLFHIAKAASTKTIISATTATLV